MLASWGDSESIRNFEGSGIAPRHGELMQDLADRQQNPTKKPSLKIGDPRDANEHRNKAEFRGLSPEQSERKQPPKPQEDELHKGRKQHLEDPRLSSWNRKVLLVTEANDRKWAAHFLELEDFCRRKGHCNVPNWYKNDGSSLNLGKWVIAQRRLYKIGKLPAERKKCIDSLGGFAWNATKGSIERWALYFLALEDFHGREGHCNVSHGYVHTGSRLNLGIWVYNQRALFRAGRLAEERKKQLDKLCFSWHCPLRSRKLQAPRKPSEEKRNNSTTGARSIELLGMADQTRAAEMRPSVSSERQLKASRILLEIAPQSSTLRDR